MLFSIDRDKMAVKMDAMEEQIRTVQENYNALGSKSNQQRTSSKTNTNTNTNKRPSPSNTQSRTATSKLSQSQNSNNLNLTTATATFPTFSGVNPYLDIDADEIEIVNVDKFTLYKTYNVHNHAVSQIALHPNKDIIATASDDTTWKLWNLPSGELIMSGEGHKDWISGCSFDPSGAYLATSSGLLFHSLFFCIRIFHSYISEIY